MQENAFRMTMIGINLPLHPKLSSFQIFVNSFYSNYSSNLKYISIPDCCLYFGLPTAVQFYPTSSQAPWNKPWNPHYQPKRWNGWFSDTHSMIPLSMLGFSTMKPSKFVISTYITCDIRARASSGCKSTTAVLFGPLPRWLLEVLSTRPTLLWYIVSTDNREQYLVLLWVQPDKSRWTSGFEMFEVLLKCSDVKLILPIQTSI